MRVRHDDKECRDKDIDTHSLSSLRPKFFFLTFVFAVNVENYRKVSLLFVCPWSREGERRGESGARRRAIRSSGAGAGESGASAATSARSSTRSSRPAQSDTRAGTPADRQNLRDLQGLSVVVVATTPNDAASSSPHRPRGDTQARSACSAPPLAPAAGPSSNLPSEGEYL